MRAIAKGKIQWAGEFLKSLSFHVPPILRQKEERKKKKRKKTRDTCPTYSRGPDYSLQHFITRTCVTPCINFNARECSHEARRCMQCPPRYPLQIPAMATKFLFRMKHAARASYIFHGELCVSARERRALNVNISTGNEGTLWEPKARRKERRKKGNRANVLSLYPILTAVNGKEYVCTYKVEKKICRWLL